MTCNEILATHWRRSWSRVQYVGAQFADALHPRPHVYEIIRGSGIRQPWQCTLEDLTADDWVLVLPRPGKPVGCVVVV